MRIDRDFSKGNHEPTEETEQLEEKVRQLIEGLFGKEAAREPLEIRRAILREIEGNI
jgi:hypothetical protein